MTTPDGVQNVYTYDDAGNRLTKTSTVDGISAVTEYTYDEQNRLLQTKAYVVGDTTKVYTYFGYDNNGNQIAKWTQTIGTTNNTGLFLRMPVLKAENYANGDTSISFYLNKGTFFSNMPKDADLTNNYSYLINLFTTLINEKYAGFAKADGVKQMITVKLCQPIKTNKDIDKMIDVINTMYTSYLVSANLKYN